MATRKTTAKPAATKSSTPAKKAAPRKKPQSIKAQFISDDEVAQQAYMLWLQRGGSELDNWLEAERQLR